MKGNKYQVSNSRFHQFKKDLVKLLVYLGEGGHFFIAPTFSIKYHLKEFKVYGRWSDDKIEHFFKEVDGERINQWVLHYHDDYLYVE